MMIGKAVIVISILCFKGRLFSFLWFVQPEVVEIRYSYELRTTYVSIQVAPRNWTPLELWGRPGLRAPRGAQVPVVTTDVPGPLVLQDQVVQ